VAADTGGAVEVIGKNLIWRRPQIIDAVSLVGQIGRALQNEMLLLSLSVTIPIADRARYAVGSQLRPVSTETYQ
jgi:hypothetical protein